MMRWWYGDDTIHIHAVRSNGVGLNVGELLLIPITATVRTDPQLQQQNKTTVRARAQPQPIIHRVRLRAYYILYM